MILQLFDGLNVRLEMHQLIPFMKALFLIVFLGCTAQLSAQNSFDERLLSKFSSERIVELQENHSDILSYWTYYLDNSYYIIDGETSGKTIATNETVSISDLSNFNILDLGLNMDRNFSKTFQIVGANKYLMLLSNREFVAGFNAYQSKTAAK